MTTETFGTTTGSTDPWTEAGYSEWVNHALEVRKAWMRMMGMDEQEIAAHCAADPPTDMDEELAQYNSMFQVQRMNQGT